MSYNLWRLFYEDDVDSFRQYLVRATFERNPAKVASTSASAALKVGSPVSLGTSPRTPVKTRKGPGAGPSSASRGNPIILTRGDVNARDAFGRTLLHYAVSSENENALEFVKMIIELPFLDLYIQDSESGWTALHRALYTGNVAAAQLLMIKDIQNATDYTTAASHSNAGGLIKIKDHEGNSPFEVFGLTVASRSLQKPDATIGGIDDDSVSVNSFDATDVATPSRTRQLRQSILKKLAGDEIFAFGSNKNITLGLGDGDDRHYPERVQLKRPAHLLRRLLREHNASRRHQNLDHESSSITIGGEETASLPAMVKHKPIVIGEVVMSKLHTAILTTDPVSNLYVCGFGPGGRLGTGDEATRFEFACLQSSGLANRKVISIALGQDHSVAVCSSGEVFTWGSNKHGQLGYELPELSPREVPLQLSPRQIYGLIKKEQIIGAAASSIHSVIYTSSGLYTFGKNEGQLGLMDADARSLEVQTIPRRVGVSVLQSPIESVSAIDRATVVLLESHDVVVFTHFGWTKIVFPLEMFGSDYAAESFFTRHQLDSKHISKVTASGSTICALSSHGEVFTINVPAKNESVPTSKSTTNPAKAKNALPTPQKIWAIRKSHMAAIDAAVGQDGSIILCTASGTVWKKEKRANIKSLTHGSSKNAKAKDYKFVRVPNIFGAIGVRSNAHGAFTAIRQDVKVMQEEIFIDKPALWTDLFELLAFKDHGADVENDPETDQRPRFWQPVTKGPSPIAIKNAIFEKPDAEEAFEEIAKRYEPLASSGYDAWITSTISDVRVPVHMFILKARSGVLRKALAEFQDTYFFSVPDLLNVEYDSNGQVQIQFSGMDFLTIVNFVLYLYTDTIADFWRHTSHALHMAPRYRQIRIEMMRLAAALDMKQLERAVRVMEEPPKSLHDDMEAAFLDSDFFSDADVVIDLAEGDERYAHGTLLSARCPFFEGLLSGRAGGLWVADRKAARADGFEPIHIDLTDLDAESFELVLRHIYADTGDELFDEVVADDVDTFIDIAIDIMAAGNELMLDRLAQACQVAIGKFVTPRNICGLLNTIAESSVNEFKQAALEYIALNLENMLDQRLLEELDDELMQELGETVRENQRAFMPFARSDIALRELMETNPGLAAGIDISRQRRIDGMKLQTRFAGDFERPSAKLKVGSYEKERIASETSSPRIESKSPKLSPTLAPLDAEDDLQFDMDEDDVLRTPGHAASKRPSASRLESAADHKLDPSSGLAVSPEPQVISTSAHDAGLSPSMTRLPWSTPRAQTERFDFKDIMHETSIGDFPKTRSLRESELIKNKPVAKISQKERKRQQQEAKLKAQAPDVPDVKPKYSEAGGQVNSPWQKLVSPAAADIDVSKIQSPHDSAGSKPSARRPQPNPTQSADKKPSSTMASHPRLPNRSVSAPITSSPQPVPQIQSIRHTPLPTSTPSAIDSRTSLADILNQQASEKIIIQEGATKRSLQEIQEEQEFQEWWDKESQRIQQEERDVEAATSSSARRGKGGRGRGRKSLGRGGAASDKQESRHNETKPQSVKMEQRDSGSRQQESGKIASRRGAHGNAGRGRGAAARGRGQSQPAVI